MSTPPRIIPAGTRKGRLVVTKDRTGGPVEARCDCGNTVTWRLDQWDKRDACTDCRGTTHTVYRAGMRFGRLTLVRKVGSTADKHALWLADCDCGNQVTVPARNAGKGITQSCGCFQREQVADRNRTHGMSQSPEYRIWSGMLSRCHNPNDTGYYKYGARGVVVCDRWRGSFEAFYADMGPRPDGMSIDRIDPEGNYEPGNCRWATTLVQARNKRPRGKAVAS